MGDQLWSPIFFMEIRVFGGILWIGQRLRECERRLNHRYSLQSPKQVIIVREMFPPDQ